MPKPKHMQLILSFVVASSDLRDPVSGREEVDIQITYNYSLVGWKPFPH